MESYYYDKDVYVQPLWKLQSPEFNQLNAIHLRSWGLSGGQTYNRILALHDYVHTGRLMVKRSFVLKMLPYGVMQFFGFPNWQELDRKWVEAWIDNDHEFEVNRDLCEFELIFGGDPRREINRYMQQAEQPAKQMIQLRKVLATAIITSAVEIDRRGKPFDQAI